jgi:hemerythrin-like domain-containing protein
VLPTEILNNEHRVIEQVLNCLEKIAERCAADGRLNRPDAEQALDFFRTFADQCHHHKEEDHLFRVLEAKGYSRRNGPTGVMLGEHELGRLHLRAMATAAARAEAGDPAAVDDFLVHAVSYVRLLREHIRKEDDCLFPMADRTLTAREQSDLLAAFDHVEADELRAGTHERYLRLADDLADRYGVPHAFAGTSQGGCACGHGGRH